MNSYKQRDPDASWKSWMLVTNLCSLGCLVVVVGHLVWLDMKYVEMQNAVSKMRDANFTPQGVIKRK